MRSLLVSSVCRLRWIALLVGCAFVACAISPKPEPPEDQPDAAPDVWLGELPDAMVDAPPDVVERQDVYQQPPTAGIDATLDPDRVSTADGHTRGEELSLMGEPEAASPSGATVRVYNLDSEDPPVETTVQGDGSFQLTLPAEPDDEIRLQVVTEQSRSAPIDAYFGTLVGLPEVDVTSEALESCLAVDPAYELEVVDSATISVTNNCSYEVVLDEPQPRVVISGLELGAEQTWPLTLAPGSSVSVTVSVSADSSLLEEIIFILVSEPVAARYPITLYVAP